MLRLAAALLLTACAAAPTVSVPLGPPAACELSPVDRARISKIACDRLVHVDCGFWFGRDACVDEMNARDMEAAWCIAGAYDFDDAVACGVTCTDWRRR